MKELNARNEIEELGIEFIINGTNEKIMSARFPADFDSKINLTVAESEKITDQKTVVKTRSLSTHGLCIIETQLGAIKDTTGLMHIHGPHVNLSFLFQSSPTFSNQKTEEFAKQVFASGDLKLASGSDTSFDIVFPGNTDCVMVNIIMSRKYYLELSRNELLSHNFSLFKSVKENHVFNSESKVNGNVPIVNLMNKIIDNQFVGTLKRHYIDSKIKGMFSLFHEQEMQKIPALHQSHDENVEKLYQAREILSINYQDPPTIKMLSKLVALNELKLKKGFKSLFGSTIHNHLTKVRMQKAQSMLNEKNILILDVAIKMGYKDTSHFIKTFKRYYGHTPKIFYSKLSETEN